MLVEVYNRSRIKLAVLHNATNVTEEKILNGLDNLAFWLPVNDDKNTYCELFNLVTFNNSVYRITDSEIDTKDNKIYYKCEHIIAKLIDSVLYGYHVVGNLGYYTSQVIEYVLNGQEDFVLDNCQFMRQFEYGWEQENRYTALFNIPSNFTDNYIWKFDTSVYPYKVNLLTLSTDGVADHYFRTKFNILRVNKKSSATDICTRLFILGAGEGVNQVGYGLDCLQAPDEYIEKYGIIERIWIDRRYENLDSLLEAGAKMLEALQEPYTEWILESAILDLSVEYKVGEIVEIIDTETGIHHKTYITGIKRIYSDVDKMTITIANKPSDIAGTVADLADRQRIEMAYSQGATQIYTAGIQENASSDEGATLDFYIPAEASIINSVVCKIRRSQFRAYSKATGGGGSYTETTLGGGAINKSSEEAGSIYESSLGGGSISQSSESAGDDSTTSASNTIYNDTSFSNAIVSKSTEGGGGSTATSVSDSTNDGSWSMSSSTPNAIYNLYPSGVDVANHWHALASHTHHHSHDVPVPTHTHLFEVPSHKHEFEVLPHTHAFTPKAHKHYISVNSHTHTIKVDAHSHTIKVDAHTHGLNIPEHTHDITPGIYRYGSTTSCDLYVAGNKILTFNSTSYEVDITNYLVSSSTNLIPRGEWLEVTVVPNDLAYISISLAFQGYIQSRGDATV